MKAKQIVSKIETKYDLPLSSIQKQFNLVFVNQINYLKRTIKKTKSRNERKAT